MGKILGKFTGKCCDADVVNNNGMYLSRELFNNLISSEDYKTAIKNKYYIGFLGHPEDPNCMDFRNACVVMTDMQMESNGDITGSFDLVDTPVGRVVKAFVDAGVKFGISIRGAGDVANDGTVDPDTFVFRGFDLVTFPAYNDCVPEFQEIAASTDVDQQKKYKKVCNAVRKNLSSINSCEAIEVLQDQFNENSKEYKMLEDRAKKIQSKEDKDLYVEVLEQKVQGLVKAYAEKVKECNSHKSKVSIMNEKLGEFRKECDKAKRVAEIACSQSVSASANISKLQEDNRVLRKKVTSATRCSVRAKSKINDLENSYKSIVASSDKIKEDYNKLNSKYNSIVKSNLLSDKKVEASESLLKGKEDSIKSLEDRVRKTVAENERLSKEVSNREAKIEDLTSKIKACESILLEYQQECADAFAYEVGIHLDNVPVTSSTSVSDLKSYIYSKASLATGVPSSDKYSEYEEVDGSSEDLVVC